MKNKWKCSISSLTEQWRLWMVEEGSSHWGLGATQLNTKCWTVFNEHFIQHCRDVGCVCCLHKIQYMEQDIPSQWSHNVNCYGMYKLSNQDMVDRYDAQKNIWSTQVDCYCNTVYDNTIKTIMIPYQWTIENLLSTLYPIIAYWLLESALFCVVPKPIFFILLCPDICFYNKDSE